MSTDGELLLRAIFNNPAEDTPRLVYADWLEEQGEHDWAEFIRTEVAVEHAPECPDYMSELGRCPCLRCELRRKVDRLQNCPSAVKWRRLPWGASARIDFRRGFLFRLQVTTAQWLAHADAITAAHPIERVRLTTWPEWDFNEFGAALKGRDRRDRLWGGDHSRRDIALRLLAGEWPRIAFELPPGFVTRTAR